MDEGIAAERFRSAVAKSTKDEWIDGTGAAPARLGYLPAFDGLRGLAVITVIVFHLGPGVVPFGSHGVDVFFALSGFLITTLIVEEKDQQRGKFAFGRFYARRSLRLFPALYAMLVVSGTYLTVRWSRIPGFLADGSTGDPHLRQTMAKYLAAAATYTSNLREVATRPGNLFGHTWSLAVEEQFYLVWPMLLCVCLAWFSRAHLANVLALLLLGCFAVRLGATPPILYRVVSKVRPDGLLAGSAAAMLRLGSPRLCRFVRRHAVVIAELGMLGIVATAYLRFGSWSENGMNRVGYTPLAVSSTALILVLALCPATTNWPWLRTPGLVRIGKISYGLYIWHYPIFVIIGWELAGLPAVARIALKLIVTGVVAALSMRYLEQPAMRWQRRFRVEPNIRSI